MEDGILVCIADRGSADFYAPADGKLRARHNVTVLVDPKGAGIDALKERDIDYVEWDGGDITPHLKGKRLVLCGTAGKKKALWRAAAVAAKKAKVRFLLFGDFFNSGCEADMTDLVPDAFCGIDQSTVIAFKGCHKTFTGPAAAVGNPGFDQLHEYGQDLLALRKHARHTIGLLDSDRLIVYGASGQKPLDSNEPVDVIVKLAKKYRAKVAIRIHPSDRKDPDLMETKIKPLLARYREALGDDLVDTSGLSETQAIAAADVFLTDYSTGGIKAILIGIPTGYIMFKSVQEYQTTRNGKYPFFPILDRELDPPPAVGIFDPFEAVLLEELFEPGFAAMAVDSIENNFRSLMYGATNRFVRFVNGELM